ncbi:MAG: UDP-N-acetylglucosamine--N-acetylmuramyl-(pentapeptide) pyrophosphoryl-undecaprenol N-acetylglucosamine transferase [Deltaproteobacteria bacterium ADurb.Bin510]|nr:MAG: UDP-N-acetylglucosamine--N-acetylmuramyl-(pentapeptide) pyrophosphoryl-undecaprenol N-acetylglucosamine transferase [Deltaproteobacteria bacterium ADurb.Bin510]
MAAVYAQTRLCVTRAGGLSLAELSRLGIPAIMVPFPLATDDHQSANAAYVAAAGGGIVIKDAELSGATLAKAIAKQLENEDDLRRAAEAMRSIGLGDGAESIAEEILSV